MESINEAIIQLRCFSDCGQVPEIIEDLNNYINKKAKVEDVRKQLIFLLNSDLTRFPPRNKVQLPDLIHHLLLLLAEKEPINQEDPISLDEIMANDRIFISSGHQFSLENLIEFHNMRPSRIGENYEKKLINPFTNEVLSKYDEMHILANAFKAGFSVVDYVRPVNERPRSDSMFESIFKGNICESTVRGANIGGKAGLFVGIYLTCCMCYLLLIAAGLLSLPLLVILITQCGPIAAVLLMLILIKPITCGLFAIGVVAIESMNQAVKDAIRIIVQIPFLMLIGLMKCVGMMLGSALGGSLALTNKIIQAPFMLFNRNTFRDELRLPHSLPAVDCSLPDVIRLLV